MGGGTSIVVVEKAIALLTVMSLPKIRRHGVDVDYQSLTFVQGDRKDWEFDYDEELNMRLFIGDFEGYKEVLSKRLEDVFEEYGESATVKVDVYAYDEERGYDVPVEVVKKSEEWYVKLPDGEEVYIGDIEEERSLADEFSNNNYYGIYDKMYQEHLTGVRAAEYVFAVPNPNVELWKDVLKKTEEEAIKSVVNANDEAIGKVARETGGSCETGEGDKSLSCHIYTESERYPYIIVYVH